MEIGWLTLFLLTNSFIQLTTVEYCVLKMKISLTHTL